MPYFILDLIQQVPFVEVPHLGRFEAVLDPAVIDIQRAEAYPPQLRTRFHAEDIEKSQLLSAYMHYASGIEVKDAEAGIEEFVQQILKKTKDYGTYSINGFGTFTNTYDETLRFTPDWEAFNVSFSGLKSIHLPFQVAKEEESSFVESPQENYSGLEDVPTQLNEVEVDISKPEEVAENVNSEITPISNEPERVEAEPDSVSANLWWGILISALILISFLCAYLAYDIISNRNRVPDLGEQPIVVIQDSVSYQPTTSIDSVDEVQPDTNSGTIDSPATTQPTQVEPMTQDPTACYIIVGAFTDEDNMIRMEEKLSSAGMQSARITGSNLTRIGIPTACDQASKLQTLQKAKSEITAQAWIY